MVGKMPKILFSPSLLKNVHYDHEICKLCVYHLVAIYIFDNNKKNVSKNAVKFTSMLHQKY